MVVAIGLGLDLQVVEDRIGEGNLTFFKLEGFDEGLDVEFPETQRGGGEFFFLYRLGWFVGGLLAVCLISFVEKFTGLIIAVFQRSSFGLFLRRRLSCDPYLAGV